MYTILITTGATITFKSLINRVTDVEFIHQLIKLNVSKLFIQFGNEIKNSKNVSVKFFKDLITSKRIVKEFEFEQVNEFHFRNSHIEIVAFPYSTNINDYIRQSDLVISHAGTGSIIDSLALHKKLMVIINDQLMDNHQLEIANEFSNLNYCKSYEIQDMNELFFKDLDQLLNDKIILTQFQESNGMILKSIISEELSK